MRLRLPREPTKSRPARERRNEQDGYDCELVGSQAGGSLRGHEGGIDGSVVQTDVADYFAVILGYPGNGCGECREEIARKRAAQLPCYGHGFLALVSDVGSWPQKPERAFVCPSAREEQNRSRVPRDSATRLSAGRKSRITPGRRNSVAGCQGSGDGCLRGHFGNLGVRRIAAGFGPSEEYIPNGALVAGAGSAEGDPND